MGVMGKMGLKGLMNSRRKLSFSLPYLGKGPWWGSFQPPLPWGGAGGGFPFYFTITSKAPGKVRVIPSGPTATTRVI